MNTPADKDKRQHERLPMRSSAQLLLPGAPPVVVRTSDISLGGLGVVASANPPEKLEVRLRVAIPLRPTGHQVVELRARVQHSVFSRRDDGFRIGLALLSPSPEALSAIVNYLNK